MNKGLRDVWNYVRRFNVCVIKVPEGEEKEESWNIFEKKDSWKISKSGKNYNLGIHETRIQCRKITGQSPHTCEL